MSSTELPLVTAVMITGKDPERRPFANASIRAFLNQTYSRRNLLIVNDGPSLSAVLADLSPLGGSRVLEELVREPGLSLGTLRNIALNTAAAIWPGSWIMQWDDDDWHHDTAIGYQVQEALQHGSQPTVLCNQVRYSFTRDSAYIYRNGDEGIAGTILHPPTEKRYPASAKGEDSDFLLSLGLVHRIENPPELYLRFHTGRNTWSERHIMREMFALQHHWRLPYAVGAFLRRILEQEYSDQLPWPEGLAASGPPGINSDLSARVVIGMTASPRGNNYVERSLRAVMEQGVEAVHVFAEPGTNLQFSFRPRPLLIHHNVHRRGNWHNWLDMARWLLDNTQQPYILTVEDDIAMRNNAVADAVSAIPDLSDVGLLSLFLPACYHQHWQVYLRDTHLATFCSEKQARKYMATRTHSQLRTLLRDPGIQHIPVPRLYGAEALLFPRRVLEDVVNHKIAWEWQGSEGKRLRPEQINNADIVIGEVVNALGLKMYFMCPSGVQHIGEESTLGHDEGLNEIRRAADFQG